MKKIFLYYIFSLDIEVFNLPSHLPSVDHGVECLKLRPRKSSLKSPMSEVGIQLFKQVHFTKEPTNNNNKIQNFNDHSHSPDSNNNNHRNMQHYHEEYIEDELSELESSELEQSEVEVI